MDSDARADTEVLVVGAGPTGLMLANQLARCGVNVTIIDRHGGPAEQSRAIAVQPRTLEIYAKMGVSDTALSLGVRATGANLWSNGRWRTRIPVDDIGRDQSAFPFILMLGQDDNERILGATLQQQGVTIQWRTELVALEQHATHVTATLKDASGERRTIEASWVAGCDGSHSAVRTLSNIEFPGENYEHTFFVADTEATGPMRPGELNIYLWRNGFHLFFPMRGENRWRVIGILPERFNSQTGGHADVTFDALVPSIREEAGADLAFLACHWFSTYRIAHRAADHFRDRRCFVLGDAAHIHSPAGGQGMNTGLQDAYNLAWKLALVVKKRAAATLLDSYEQERRPVAQRLLKTTDRAFQVLVSDRWPAAVLRTTIVARLAAIAMRIEPLRMLAFRTISQLGVSYPAADLSQTLAGASGRGPGAGERFPWLHLALGDAGESADLFEQLDDTRFNLLLFGGNVATTNVPKTITDIVAVHAIPATSLNTKALTAAGIDTPSFYLLRPDGHIGLVGGVFQPAALTHYFSQRVHLIADARDHQA